MGSVGAGSAASATSRPGNNTSRSNNLSLSLCNIFLMGIPVQFEIIEKVNPNATDKLSGKTFVVSGIFEKFSRDDLKKAIEDNGGKVGSSISAKTDYVVAGDNMGPAKLEKATKSGLNFFNSNSKSIIPFLNDISRKETITFFCLCKTAPIYERPIGGQLSGLIKLG